MPAKNHRRRSSHIQIMSRQILPDLRSVVSVQSESMGSQLQNRTAKFISRWFKRRISGSTIDKSSKVDRWTAQAPDTRATIDCAVKANYGSAGFIRIKRNYAGEAVIAALRNGCVQHSACIIQTPCLDVCRNKLGRRHGGLAIDKIQGVQSAVAGDDKHPRLSLIDHWRIVQRKRAKPIAPFGSRLIRRKICFPSQCSRVGVQSEDMVGASSDNDQIPGAISRF